MTSSARHGIVEWWVTTTERTVAFADKVAHLMGVGAGIVYILLALYISADVLARRFIGVSSRSTVEVSGYLMATAIAWGLSATLMNKGHIRVDIVVARLPPRLRAVMHLVAVLSLAVFSAILVWRAWAKVAESVALDAHDRSALSVPLAFPQAIWATGISACLLLTLLLTTNAVFLLITGQLGRLESRIGVHSQLEEALVLPEAAVEDESRGPTLT